MPSKSGTVSAFGHDGWGVITGSDGNTHPFHSTAIADGSRKIDVGSEVTYTLVPGHRGRWEAAGLLPQV
jgi:cold shock CspA family protein